MTKRTPFIQGFRQPTLSKNSFLTLSDVRGDGEGKLVIWSEQQNELIVYKGSNRQLQKPVKLKNVSGIIQYQDEERNAQAVIGLSAQNGFYIFRSLSESFRLKIPDIYAEPEQQLAWTQYETNPERLAEELMKLNPNTLSESAKYFLGSNTVQRKKELIQYVFTEGINQKDSISAMTLLRNSDSNFMGNVVIGTQLRRLYILDAYGHSIISRRAIPFAPSIILGYGSITSKYVIVCIGREGQICIYMQKDLDEPSEKINNSSRIVSACLSFPDVLMASADQNLSQYTLSLSNSKILAKKYSIKFGSQPIKVEYLKVKGQKLSIVAFQNEVRFYNEKELNYTFVTDFKLYNLIWGSFAREECCLILLYQNAGFQVLILHRQFNVKQKYGSNKIIQKEFENIPIPKRTSHFITYWNDDQTDETLHYRLLEQGMKLLKWRTLSEKFSQGGNKSNGKIEINSTIVGMGPIFKVQLEIQNLSQQVLFDVGVMLNYDSQKLQLSKSQQRISMLAPLTPTSLQFQLTSLTLKNESLFVQLISSNNITSTTVFIPNCQQFSNG